jgi:hypothetical protein
MALSFIRSSGNVITEDFCTTLVSESRAEYVKDNSFGTGVRHIDEEIARAFERLRRRWEEIRVQVIDDKLDNAVLRKKWIIPFLEELAYKPVYLSSNLISKSGTGYQIPYRGWDHTTAPVIQMAHSSRDFDLKDKSSRTHPNKSPHDALQLYLNTSNHRWAMLTNGKKIRILRDFYHSITKGFLEFDLEAIFENASSEHFRVLYRILHRSRFENQYRGTGEIQYDDEGNPVETEEACLLELFHKKSRETGVKIGTHLRDQVVEAIEKLGNGFAESLDPDEFQNGKVKEYYSEILNIIYRLLFLMFAEQKGWLPVRNLVYAQTYSVGSLRGMAERGGYDFDEEKDLWEGLKITFRLASGGYTFPNGDTVNAFGGQLFSEKKIKILSGLSLKNRFLLEAIYRLSYFRIDSIVNRINYANLAIDELGSVYESLLDFEPKIAVAELKIDSRQIRRGEFYLDNRGTERKTTGSYYTDSRLVAQLIDSALVPVIDNALADKISAEEKEQALLDLKVADIACGSGAFLIAAMEKLGERLALIRKGEEERPTDEQLREARRDVLLNCIYGVDLNPMAVELAKFSLWITASLPDMPLSFLDHKIKCGNSLIGATPDLVKKGIPEGAYNAVTLDNPAICSELRRKVKRELQQIDAAKEPSVQYGLRFEKSEKDELLHLRENLISRHQEEADEVDLVEEEYRRLEKMERKFKDWILADVWTSAFFIMKNEHDLTRYPTNATLEAIRENQYVDRYLIEEALRLSQQYRFFHFHLEFPEVFEKGGFDCLLGNPPWETVEFKTQEFFKNTYPSISKLKIANKRAAEISKLKNIDPETYKSYEIEEYRYESIKRYFKFCELYPLTIEGKINLYSKFSERIIYLSKTSGIIVQGDIATGFDTRNFFNYLISNKLLKSLHHFHNRGKFFDIHRDTRFALLTLSSNSPSTEFMFNITSFDEININDRKIYLSSDDIFLINPNTRTAPILRNVKDLEIIKKLYSYPIVFQTSSNNPWIINNHRMLNGSDDSEYLRNLTSFSGVKRKNRINLIDGDGIYLPVYESKLIWQYDHRFGTYMGITNEAILNSNPRNLSIEEKKDPEFEVLTRDYLSEIDFNKKYSSNYSSDWMIIYRNVTGAVNYRTTVATIIPKIPVVLSAYILEFDSKHKANEKACFLANINSFVFDFVCRNKIGGSHLSVYSFDQIPVIPPEFYTEIIINEISHKVLNLCYTSHSIRSLAVDLGFFGEPFVWNEKERFQLQCELDAIYAHLYGLEKAEMDYILETFPIVKRKDIGKYGTYRTKETILKLYDEFAWVRKETNYRY